MGRVGGEWGAPRVFEIPHCVKCSTECQDHNLIQIHCFVLSCLLIVFLYLSITNKSYIVKTLNLFLLDAERVCKSSQCESVVSSQHFQWLSHLVNDEGSNGVQKQYVHIDI